RLETALFCRFFCLKEPSPRLALTYRAPPPPPMLGRGARSCAESITARRFQRFPFEAYSKHRSLDS
ncbi:hypothetical protein PoB_003372300, partial [Plakobranchus ocellatus]